MTTQSNESYAPAEFRFTGLQSDLVKSAVKDLYVRGAITSGQRSAVVEICAWSERWNHTPEQLLIAFKYAMYDAADNANIPHGGEREDLLARLVSVFIEALFEVPPPPRNTIFDGAGRLSSPPESFAGGP